MEKEFVTYEQALALQKLGVYIQPPVYCCYQKTPVLMILPSAMTTFDIIAPLKSQVFRWFREKRNLIGLIESGYDNGINMFSYVIWRGSFDDWIGTYRDTYEEAENACINKLIEMAKQ